MYEHICKNSMHVHMQAEPIYVGDSLNPMFSLEVCRQIYYTFMLLTMRILL